MAMDMADCIVTCSRLRRECEPLVDCGLAFFVGCCGFDNNQQSCLIRCVVEVKLVLVLLLSSIVSISIYYCWLNHC
jgi:hypothetical protein